MKQLWYFFLKTILFLLTLCSLASGYTVSGKATSDQNCFDVIPGAIVTIAGKTDTTDANGAYSIANVPSGSQPISISHPSYTFPTSSYTLNITGNTTQNFTGHCKATAQVTYSVPSSFTPGISFDITVSLTNINYAISGVPAYLDVSFPSFTTSSPPVTPGSQSGFDANPSFYPSGSSIYKLSGCSWGPGTANYLLVTAARTATIYYNDPWSYTLHVTPPSSLTSDFTIYIKGNIGDSRDPSSGTTRQQGLYEKVVTIPKCGPIISAPTTLPPFPMPPVGSFSQPESLNVSGSCLSCNITITASRGFKVSTDKTYWYSTTDTYPPFQGQSGAKIYVRYERDLSQTPLTGTLKLSTCGNPDSIIVTTNLTVPVIETQPLIPENFFLSQSFPNPFNPSTTIKYGLPQSAQVTLSVFNALGQRVAVLVDNRQEAGYHEASFNASNLGSGVYFYRLQAGDFTSVQKMLLLK
jgi:hypothetical protein